MKGIVVLFFLSLINLNAPCQKVQTIRFIYCGEEIKPRGTLLISVDEYVAPTDKLLDSSFGKGIKTDKQTFAFINTFIRKNKYTNNYPNKVIDSLSSYEIITPDKTKFVLNGKYFEPFFTELASGLRQNKLDSIVEDAVEHYYSNWRHR